MKLNRILQIVLVGIIVIFVAVAGFLYAANSREVKRNEELNDTIAKNQAILNKGLAEKAAKEKEATLLASELASANRLLDQTDFRASAESIEYDRILFSLASTSKLQVSGLTATLPLDTKDKDTTYQLTTVTITVEGLTPDSIFGSPADSTAYITATVNNVLTFVNKVASSADFDTAAIQSVNITAPEPMTDEEITGLIEDINSKIEEELKDVIDARTEEIQTQYASTLTQEEIDKMIADETAVLVKNELASKTAAEIKAILEQAGIDKPSAVITIKIWTHKGA